jgi:hyperosmotically inducible periplasmic protein
MAETGNLPIVKQRFEITFWPKEILQMRTNGMALSGLVVCLTLGGIALTGTGCAGNRYQRSTGAFIDDKGITARVKTALFRDPNVSGFDVHVNTFRGDVQLSGFVDTPEQKEHAAAIASEVAGVQQVNNNLEVKPRAVGTPGAAVENSSRTITETPPADAPRYPAPIRDNADRLDDRSRLTDRDRVLDRNIDPNANLAPVDNSAAVSTGPLSNARNVEIHVVNGRATLRGIVPSEDEKRSMGRKLLSLPGVITLDNQLEVQPVIKK